MTLTAKEEAIAQITRAVRGLEVAIDKLEEMYSLATVADKRELLRLITELGERLDVNRIFLAHIKAAEVTVKKPQPGAYEKLDAALARLQKLEVQTGATKKVIRIASALAGAVKKTRNEVSSRAV